MLCGNGPKVQQGLVPLPDWLGGSANASGLTPGGADLVLGANSTADGELPLAEEDNHQVVPSGSEQELQLGQVAIQIATLIWQVLQQMRGGLQA